MKIGGIDFSYVLDHAARTFATETEADTTREAEAHETVRTWFDSYRPIIETWLTPPTVFDARGLVYRRLIDHLRGDNNHTPADHKGSIWVIAAGNAWNEIPAHRLFGYSPEATALIECEA